MSMTLRTAIRIGAFAVACGIALTAGSALAQDDLCGRSREAPETLLKRLTKTEKLGEAFRDKAYVTVNDAAKGTIWTFTVTGHPAHPSVVCRQPVEDGGRLRIDMGVQCEASEEQCEQLVRGFEALNQKMLKDAEKQAK
jgi:hypothetical protein